MFFKFSCKEPDKSLNNLTTLNVSSNKISGFQLDNGFNGNLLSLQTLDLSSNKLTSLDIPNIQHKCTMPSTPQTNGMVERVNGTIKNNTILKYTYNNKDELEKDLMKFLVYYNLYRRHGSLRKELDVKTPFDAIKKWYELKPELFIQKPDEFKIKILNLYPKIVNLNQQPCET